jgi:isoaspartyl peptidase/L-asparaginase-like protein (Ntn-hydrolase superfamily)
VEKRRPNSAQFQNARVLAERIEQLTKERQEAQTQMLEAHGRALGEVQTTLSLLVERTENLSKLTERVTVLEKWKAFMAGVAAAFTMIGGTVGWLVGYFVNGNKR